MTSSASGRLGLLLGDRIVVFLFEMCGKNFSVFTLSFHVWTILWEFFSAVSYYS